MIKFLDLKKQYESIKSEIDEAIFNVIKDTAFVGGKYVEEFEKSFAEFIGVKHAIGVGNGTDALETALWALDLPKDSEVIVPVNTFIATSEAVSRNGLKVRFVDCNEYYQIDIEKIKETINEKTSAIIAVHLYGHPANMEKLIQIAKEYNLKVVEDAAQAHGAAIGGKKVGTFADIATFSFYPGKNLGAYGDGGMVVTNDDGMAQKMRMYCNHGRSDKYGHEFEGRNTRLDGLQAAILNVKLRYLDMWLQKRNQIARRYLDGIKNPAIRLPKVAEGVFHVWHLFVVEVEEREHFRKYLADNGIQTGIHYPKCLADLPTYNVQNDFSCCKRAKNLVSLPIGEHLEAEEVETVIATINRYKQ